MRWKQGTRARCVHSELTFQAQEYQFEQDYYLEDDVEWDNEDEVVESCPPRRPAVLHVDLGALISKHQQAQDEDNAKTITCDPSPQAPLSLQNKHQTSKEKQDDTKTKEDSLLAQVKYQVPRLVRSTSFTAMKGAPPLALRRSSSWTADISPVSTPPTPPSICCIQTLLPKTVRPCAFGPRASLVIVCSRAAVAILLAAGRPPHVVPLVGGGPSIDAWMVASRMETTLQERLSSLASKGTLKNYLEMCQTLAAREKEWIQLLEECLPVQKMESDSSLHELTAVCECLGLSTGESSDCFDLFKMSHQQGAPPATTEAPPCKETYASNVCLVCFDTMPQGALQLTSCGHQVCLDCLTAYVRSSAGSGQGSIRCAAFQCPTKFDMYDIAHILFLNGGPPQSDAADIFERLVKFEVEKRGMELCLEKGTSRFCPAPCCGRLLTSSSQGVVPGSNILLCTCGVSLCADDKCKDGRPSHPGITCERFQKLYKSIESGRLDAELANLQWMLNNSRPCPKCRFPISRTGGCNHVRCTSCQYYFCWQCGGLGNECMAFFCQNKGGYWHQEPEYDEDKYADLFTRVSCFRNFRCAEAKLEILRKNLAGNYKKDACVRDLTVLDMQLTQVALWLHGKHLVKDMDKAQANAKNDHCPGLKGLELMSHVISLRKSMVRNRVKNTSLQGSFSTEEVALAMGVSTSKPQSKRKKQAKMRVDATKSARRLSFIESNNPLERLIVDQDLENLCKLPVPQFTKKAVEAMNNAMRVLLPGPVMVKTEVLRRRSRKKKQVASGRLNEKLARPRDPWRNGMHQEDGYWSEDWSDDNDESKKTKARVSHRRRLAMERKEDKRHVKRIEATHLSSNRLVSIFD